MAENLWALREQKRLSVATLASRAGLPIGLIMEYEAGTRSIDPRHLARLAKALYVEESDVRLRCDPRPGAGQLERQGARPEGAPPAARPQAPAMPPQGPAQPPTGQPRGRTTRPPRPASEAKPPAPARASQLAHINDLLQRLNKDRAEVEAELGKSLDEIDRLVASQLLVKLQTEVRNTPTPDRHRAYLPEAVDQYELHYLTRVRDEGSQLRFALYNGAEVDGVVVGFGPYNITLRQSDGSELTLNKLAIVSYCKPAAPVAEQEASA
jgi:transcriptional regulator with XRE-family HTH domain/sRNA-binding regulator protein Hfq